MRFRGTRGYGLLTLYISCQVLSTSAYISAITSQILVKGEINFNLISLKTSSGSFNFNHLRCKMNPLPHMLRHLPCPPHLFLGIGTGQRRNSKWTFYFRKIQFYQNHSVYISCYVSRARVYIRPVLCAILDGCLQSNMRRLMSSWSKKTTTQDVKEVMYYTSCFHMFSTWVIWNSLKKSSAS